MSNEDLLKSFQVISELENRKITYEKAISKVEQEIENAGMWYREAEPIQPTQNLNHYWNKHSLRALLLFFILIPVFLLFFNAISQYIYETFEYEMNSYFATVGSIILAVISMCIVQVSLFNRMCKKENEAYFSEYHQVQQHNKQEQEQAEARSNWMRIDRKEDLKDWRSYCSNRSKTTSIISGTRNSKDLSRCNCNVVICILFTDWKMRYAKIVYEQI